MLKKITLMAAIALTGIVAKAQTNIGVNTAPDASAVLQATSTTKGFLPPVLNTLNRNSITLPATGLVIFNSTTNQMEVNTGTPGSPLWTSTNATAAAAGTSTLYTSNGALNSARTVTMGTNTLNFTGANVGIGAATPASALTINNNLSVGTGYAAIAAPTNGAIFQGNVAIGASTNVTNSGGVVPLRIVGPTMDLSSNNTGATSASLSISPSTNPNMEMFLGYDATRNVGVINAQQTGSSVTNIVISPTNVGGNQGRLFVGLPEGGTNVINTIAGVSGAYKLVVSGGSAANSVLVNGGNLILNSTANSATSGRIGVGTETPTATLDVNGAARIRSIPAVPSSTTVFPIYADASGNVLSGPAAITAGTPGAKTYYTVTSLAAGATSSQIQFSPGFGVFKIYVRTLTASAQNAVAEFLFSGNNNTAQVGLKVISSTIDLNSAGTDTYVYSNVGGGVSANIQFLGVANGNSQNFTLKTAEFTSPNLQFTITNNGAATQSYNILCEQIF